MTLRSSDSISLASFSIQFASGQQKEKVFANGRMQKQIIIKIVAVNEHDHQIILDEKQLERYIRIINLASHETSQRFYYSKKNNDYDSNFPNELATQDNGISASQSSTDNQYSPQKQIYWISTHIVGEQKIVAEITLGGEKYSTKEMELNESITLSGQPPIVYSVSDLKLETFHTQRIAVQDEIYCQDCNSFSPKEFSLTLYTLSPKNNYEIRHYCPGPQAENSYNLVHTLIEPRFQNVHMLYLWGILDRNAAENSAYGKIYFYKEGKRALCTHKPYQPQFIQKDSIIICDIKITNPSLSNKRFEEVYQVQHPFTFFDQYGNRSEALDIDRPAEESYSIRVLTAKSNMHF